MTVGPCPNGSRPQAGKEGDLVWAGTALGELISLRAPWLGAYITIMAPLLLNGATLCASPPPTLPTWTASDAAAIVLGAPSAILAQTVRYLAWYYTCECIGTTTPEPAPVPAPTDQLPVLVPEPVQACDIATGQLVDAQMIPNLLIPFPGGVAPFSRPIVPGTTQLRLRAQIDSLGTANQNTPRLFQTDFYTDSGNAGLQQLILTPPVLDGEAIYDVDPQITSYSVHCYFNPPTGPVAIGSGASVQVEQFCAGEPGRLQPLCCPPDPGIVAILRDLQLQVALLVAREGPAGPLEELRSTVVQAEGTQDLELGARMVLVELNTLGSGVQLVRYANPDRTMRAGTVRFGNDFGWRRREHVDNVRCLFAAPNDANVVSWSLSSGTVARLVQLGEPR